MKKLKEFIKNPENYDAHIITGKNNKITDRELLEEHLERTEKYFQILFSDKEIENVLLRMKNRLPVIISEEAYSFWIETIKGIPFFHDMGKINPSFQKDLMRNNRIFPCSEITNIIGSRHSLLSAILYLDYFTQELRIHKLDKIEKKYLRMFILIHSYIISRHHSNLESFSKYIENLLVDGESGAKILSIIKESQLHPYVKTIKSSKGSIKQIVDDTVLLKKDFKIEHNILLYFYTKLLYSLLVASDYYATTEFMNGFEIKDFGKLADFQDWQDVYENSSLMKKVRKYQVENYPMSSELLKQEKNINILRTEMLCDAERTLEKNKTENIYFLEAPTGSGKSNTAIDLTFKLMQLDDHLNKVYYIYPFNTLVEQNLNTLKKIFENHKEILNKIVVINSLTPIKTECDMNETGEYYQKALLNKQFLNYPFIISTHVTLFHTLFGSDKESVFGFHQLCNSIIVLDEIQSYKNNLWGEIISFLKIAAEFLNIKIIIMSATLPDLDLLTENMDPAVRLLENSRKYFENSCFKDRVKVSYELLDEQDAVEEKLFTHIEQEFRNGKKILVEFIKKDTAADFYNNLKNNETMSEYVEYMSGDDNIFERNRILQKINNSKGPLILVATQVIEAGVDIDMDIGYKNISKLDSEEQFMGRINRSCLKENSSVYFFNIDSSKSIYKDEVRVYKEFTLENENIREYLLNKDFNQYYKKILETLKIKCNNTVSGLKEFYENQVGSLNFPIVEEKMKLIPNEDWSMSVFLARTLVTEDGEEVDGENIWNSYKELLLNSELDYSEKVIRLSYITSKLNLFIYQIKKNPDLIYHDRIGDIFYIDDGEKYFENGKLNRKRIQGEIGDFVDFI